MVSVSRTCADYNAHCNLAIRCVRIGHTLNSGRDPCLITEVHERMIYCSVISHWSSAYRRTPGSCQDHICTAVTNKMHKVVSIIEVHTYICNFQSHQGLLV